MIVLTRSLRVQYVLQTKIYARNEYYRNFARGLRGFWTIRSDSIRHGILGKIERVRITIENSKATGFFFRVSRIKRKKRGIKTGKYSREITIFVLTPRHRNPDTMPTVRPVSYFFLSTIK